MKFLLICLVFIQYASCKSQSETGQIEIKDLIPSEFIDFSLDSSAFTMDVQMQIYADSIDSFQLSNSLPYFLFKSCFDINILFWPDFHHPISLRSEIAKRVNNKEALELLLPKLKETEQFFECFYEVKIPDSNKSFYEILNLRRQQLE